MWIGGAIEVWTTTGTTFINKTVIYQQVKFIFSNDLYYYATIRFSVTYQPNTLCPFKLHTGK